MVIEKTAAFTIDMMLTAMPEIHPMCENYFHRLASVATTITTKKPPPSSAASINPYRMKRVMK